MQRGGAVMIRRASLQMPRVEPHTLIIPCILYLWPYGMVESHWVPVDDFKLNVVWG